MMTLILAFAFCLLFALGVKLMDRLDRYFSHFSAAPLSHKKHI